MEVQPRTPLSSFYPASAAGISAEPASSRTNDQWGLKSDRDRAVRRHVAFTQPIVESNIAGIDEDIAEPESPTLMQSELDALADAQILHSRGDCLVAIGRQAQMPHVVSEIGRLREVAFRAVGEGSGKSRDIDAYDESYQHLFVWSRKERAVLGAYRLAMSDVVLKSQGPAGLYTSSLFAFQEGFFDALGPAMELGRSFVRIEYQRSSRVLAMLWRGIGRIVAMRPRYSTLFGPVSVSASYTEASRQLIASALGSSGYRHPLSARVEALRPVDTVEGPSEAPSLERLSEMVEALEPDGKGVPTLVREYVKLGGRFCSFSIDPDFQSAMDGLVVVDLCRTAPRLLALYMGPESYADFCRGKPPSPASTHASKTASQSI